MLSPQQSKMNLLLKPSNIPRLPRSCNNSPRSLNSVDISHNESVNSTQTSLNKSTCIQFLKNLNELSQSLDTVSRRSKSSDKDLNELLQNCKISIKLVKDKFKDLNFEDDLKSSDSKSSQESSLLIRPDLSEYCLFLEHIIAYEQSKTEIIIQKTKFPKIRMKEVDKALCEAFSIKQNGALPVFKPSEAVSILDKFKKDSKDLVKKTKRFLSENGRIPNDVEEMIESSFTSEEFVSISSLEGQSFIESRSFLEDSKYLIDEKRKYQDLYEQLSAEHRKLTGKYTYLISRFNNQDKEIKFQAKKLKLISKNLFELRHHFLQFVNEINSYMSTLIQSFGQHSQNITQLRAIEANSIWDTEKEDILNENENLKFKVSDLEKKLKKCENELDLLKDDSDDSLDLGSNINDIIEIQKLKDQIRLLSFKSFESSSTFQKDLDSYKSQISKLRSQNFALEERIKSLNQRIQDLYQEKEKLLNETSRFVQIDQKSPLLPSFFNKNENSSENSGKVNASSLLAIFNDDVDEIVSQLKTHKLFEQYQDNNINLLRKAVEFLVGLKEDMIDESKYFEEVLEGLVKDRRSRRFSEKQEAEAGIDSFLKDKQVEIYKTKLKDKKGQLELVKQQNDFLKRTVKDLQIEVSKGANLDIECIRGISVNIVKEIPPLPSHIEQLVLVLMKTLGLSQSEITRINLERRSNNAGIF